MLCLIDKTTLGLLIKLMLFCMVEISSNLSNVPVLPPFGTSRAKHETLLIWVEGIGTLSIYVYAFH